MARRKLSAYFEENEKHTINMVMVDMYSMMRRVIRPDITKEEVLELVYPEVLQREVTWSRNTGNSIWEIQWRPRNVRIDFCVHQMSNTPFNTIPTFQKDANPELIQRMNDWIDMEMEFSKDYGRLEVVVNELINNYTRKQVTYFFPQINLILKHAYPLRISFEAASPPKRGKLLDYPLRKAVERAYATVSTFVLLADNVPNKYAFESREVKLILYPNHVPGYIVEDGFRFNRKAII